MRWAVSLSTRSGIDGKMLNHQLWLIIASGLRSDRISQPFSGVARYNPGRDLRRNRTLLVVTQSYLQGSVGATALGRTVCGAAVERDLVPRRTKKVRKGRAWSHLHNFSHSSFQLAVYQLKWHVHFSCYQIGPRNNSRTPQVFTESETCFQPY